MKILCVLLLCVQIVCAQQLAYNNCAGAVNAPIEGRFSLSYLGLKTNNQIWVVFVAPQNGVVQIDMDQIGSSLNYSTGFYIKSYTDVCSDPLNATTKEQFELRGQKKLSITLEKNQQLALCLNTTARMKDLVLFKCAFEANNPNEQALVLDLSYDDALPMYTLVIKDLHTKTPVVSKIFLQGSAEITGSYYASTLKLTLKQNVKKGTIKIDAPGYFPVEFTARPIPLNEARSDTLYLQKFEVGKLSKLERVYFAAGLAEIMEESYPQLNRLRDLLILNPGISIEIHGHVNLDENSMKKALKLSKQRAIMVKKYLVENGIDPSRLYPIGFGSSKPVYAKPQDENQKEANRRVEILIKEH